MSISGPNVPSPTLSDIGNGRFVRGRRVAILEHFDGTMWLEIGRYGSVRDADEALDRTIATGAEVGTLRVTEAPRKTSTLVLMGVGAVAFVALLVAVVYVLSGG
ncbi:MAG: hypothetical protein ABJB55_02915 [Actinomycetota bacterium]